MNVLQKKRTLKTCHWKLTVVPTLMDDFQASEAEILNKLKKVETNKSSTLYDAGPKVLKKARTENWPLSCF